MTKSMTPGLRCKAVLALAAVGCCNSAQADGLGGLSGLAFIIFMPLSLLTLLMVGIAFLLRYAKKTRGAKILGVINAVFGLLLVLFGIDILGRPFFEALNPWLTPDTAVIASLCLAIITANLLFFVRESGGRRIVCIVLAAFLAIQLVVSL